MFLEERATAQSISMRKLVYGVGVNDVDYITTKKIVGSVLRCPFYVKWIHMLERCYSSKFQESNPSYVGCSVSDDWLIFSNFKRWMASQEWEGMHLDKDLLNKGNKIYSPKTCALVSREVNSIMSKFGAENPPKGISFSCNRYVVQCSANGKNMKFGRYKTAIEAENRYAEVKAEAVMEVAIDQDERTCDLLLKFFGMI